MAKSSKPPVRLTYKFNRFKSGTTSRGQETLIAPIQKILGERVLTVGLGKVIDRLEVHRDDIKADVERDLVQYTRVALKFFLTQTSPDPLIGRKRASSANRASRSLVGNTITFDPRGEGVEVINLQASDKVTAKQAQQSSVSGFSVFWAALAPSTVRRKRRTGAPNRGLNYFVHTGALARVLNADLAAAFKDILDFDMVIGDGPTGKTVLIKAISRKGNLGSGGLAALRGPGNALKSTGSNFALSSFLGRAHRDAVNRKLNGNTVERPFLQPMLGFWLVHRFPIVFRRAVAARF